MEQTNSPKSAQRISNLKSLKFVYEAEVRRVKMKSNYVKFTQLAAQTFNLEEDKIFFYYFDDEGDCVRITNKLEFAEAIQNATERGLNTLRIEIKLEKIHQQSGHQEVSESDPESSESDLIEEENKTKGTKGIFQNFQNNVKKNIKLLEKEVKKGKLKKVKKAVKNLKNRLKEKWKEFKSTLFKRHHHRGWRHQQWQKYQRRHHCDESRGCEESYDVVSFRSLASGKNIGPNPSCKGDLEKGNKIHPMDANRGHGPWGKFIIEDASVLFPDISSKQGQIFLAKNVASGKYLRITDDLGSGYDCNGDGKSKHCLFRLTPYTGNELKGECENLIVNISSVLKEQIVIMCNADGECLQPGQKPSSESASYFEMIHGHHIPRHNKRFQRHGGHEHFHHKRHHGWRQKGPHSCHGRRRRHGFRHHHQDHGFRHQDHGFRHRHQDHGFRHRHQDPHWNPHPFHEEKVHQHKSGGREPNDHGRSGRSHFKHEPFGPEPFELLNDSHGHSYCNFHPFEYEMVQQGNEAQLLSTDCNNTGVESGQIVIKTWNFQNTGARKWSSECSLVHMRGPNLESNGQMCVKLDHEVQPGDTINVSLKLVAPPIIGRYISYWRLADANGTYFGPRIWASVTVQKKM